MAQYLKFNSPIHNLQVFLRSIAGKYDDIPTVIPDGVYGDSTKKAVKEFQKIFMLNSTGTVDNSTWDKIVDVYRQIGNQEFDYCSSGIYPEAGIMSDNFYYTPTVYIIQTMITALSDRFSNVYKPSLSGVLDKQTVKSIKSIQVLVGLNPDGNITRLFWDYLLAIYETFISSDRVENAEFV